MPTRRIFLEASFASCLATWGWSAETPAPQITYGFSLYGTRSLPTLEAIDLCAKIGYDAVEIPAMPDRPTAPMNLDAAARREIAARLRDRNLALASIMENLPVPSDEIVNRGLVERLKRACQLGIDLGGQKRPVIETILGGKPGTWDEVKNLVVDRLGEWSRVAGEAGFVLAIKPHRMNAMNLPEQALWVLEQVKQKSLRLVYDFSHYQHRQMTIRDTLAKLLPHTVFVHIKDTVVESGKERFVLPGDGGVDYRELLAALVSGKWSGCVCVEVSGMVSSKADYDPEKAARRSYENLLPALRHAKLRP